MMKSLILAVCLMMGGCRKEPIAKVNDSEFKDVKNIYVSIHWENGDFIQTNSWESDIKISTSGIIQFPHGLKRERICRD